MKYTKRVARKIVIPIAMGLRADKLVRCFGASRILNVMYHGVVKKDSNYFSPRHLVVEQFEEHLKYYKKNFDVISVEEAFFNIQNGVKTKNNTITISFDDGYKNNHEVALPLLEKYNIPATIFVSSLCASDGIDKCLWSEYIAALNYYHRDELIRIGNYSFSNGYEPNKQITLVDFIKQASCRDRDAFIQNLVEEYDLRNKLDSIPDEVWKLMSKNELIELSRSKNISIGSHGHLHYNFGAISIDNARKDMLYSKEQLENTLDKKINMIAFPDGSYNDEVKNVAEKLGFSHQLAVTYRSSTDHNDNRIMNRHGISSGTTFDSNMLYLNRVFKRKGIKII